MPRRRRNLRRNHFSEYHLYSLERRTSIQNNESKQISLLNGTGVPVEKYLMVEGQAYYYRNPQGIGNAIPEPVKVYYRFKNEEKGGLGMPLPAGTVRVYQADSKGGVQFVGEDNIKHTPKDETLKIYIGNAFDVVCERKQTDYKKLASNLYEMEYAITLRNHKDWASDRGSARAGGRGLGSGELEFQAGEAGFDDDRVSSAGGKGWQRDADVSGAREVVRKQ